jgi:hypothetical protein
MKVVHMQIENNETQTSTHSPFPSLQKEYVWLFPVSGPFLWILDLGDDCQGTLQ